MQTEQHNPESCPTCQGSFRALVRHLRREAEEKQPVAPDETDVAKPGRADATG